VAFGGPEPIEILRVAGTGRTDEERISAALRDRVVALGAASGAVAGAEVAEPSASVIEDRTNDG
jgi:Tfp pilus assembly protein PilX